MGLGKVHLLCLCSCTKQSRYRAEDEQKQRQSAIGFFRALCIPVSPVHTLMFLISYLSKLDAFKYILNCSARSVQS